MNYRDRKQTLLILAVAVGSIVVGSLLLAGCTDPLSGDVNANLRPIVTFTNVPPGSWEEEFWTVDSITGDTIGTAPDSVVTRYTRFSRNPFVYWKGTDKDGQIDFYRYRVITTLELQDKDQDIDEYIQWLENQGETWPRFDTLSIDTVEVEPVKVRLTVDTISVWSKYLDVEPSNGDPKTTEVVKLRAFNDDPVNVYQIQYVLVQAVDEEGLGSALAVRAFSRNDNPPNTQFQLAVDTVAPFINSKSEGRVSGVSLAWKAEDPDYPAGTNAPPFEYRWTLYGPFEDFKDGDSVWKNLSENYIYRVFVSSDAKIYKQNDILVVCDTAFDAGGTVTCDTIVVIEGSPAMANIRGSWSTKFDVKALAEDDPEGPTGTNLNRVVQESEGWSNDSSTVLYNVYQNYVWPPGGDTTVEMNFIFWIDSKDDAGVQDPVPMFSKIRVIDPKHERPVLVLDFSGGASPFNAPINPGGSDFFGPARRMWKEFVDHWGEANVPGWNQNGESFDINLLEPHLKGGPDYFAVKGATYLPLPIAELLKHNVIIMYNDAVNAADNTTFEPIFRAIDVGTNVWSIMRSPVLSSSPASRDIIDTPVVQFSSDYAFYFAAEGVSFQGWLAYLFVDPSDPFPNPVRIEDFTYADPLVSSWSGYQWPELHIDTALLHANYNWRPAENPPFGWDYQWDPNLAALPEVNWMSFRTSFFERGTQVKSEPMYLYGSKYGSGTLPNGWPTFQGSPVAHRVKADYFRTVHMSFTPLAMNPEDFKIVADSMLNFLYVPRVAGTAAPNQQESGSQVSIR
ncbi:MAG: hypothetical protein P1R58_10550 [bacterium]|nr:hypothetical protein [bacterium]